MNQFISAQQKDLQTKTIKVMTYNMHHGVNNNGTFDLDAIAKIILTEKPDFVALQEVDSVIKRSHNLDLSKVLAQKTNMNAVFGKATSVQKGSYGVAILTKHPIIETKNVALPFQKNKEPRTALEIISVLKDAGDTVSFISTHLDHRAKNHKRIEQVKKINIAFSANRYPTVLAGDINDTPDSETLKLLETTWTSTYNKENPEPTYPAASPYKKIDYILYAPKNKWKYRSAKVVDDAIASDHRAYVVILELNR